MGGDRELRAFFGSPRFGEGLLWSSLGPLLPGWDLVIAERPSLAELGPDVDVLVPVGAPVGAELMRAGRLGMVQQFGVGVENIDVDAATAAGVWVCRLPSQLTTNADSVAELAVLGALAGLRRLDEARDAVRQATQWYGPVGRSLVGTNTVVVGLGAIGTALAARLTAFRTTIVGVRADPGKGAPAGVDRVVGPERLHEVLAGADVVVCAILAGPDAERLFDASAFAAMRPGSVFVNVARGSLVDDAALLDALDSGQVSAAALDVHDREPADPDSALVRHPRVVATPHIAGMTTTTFEVSKPLLADNLRRWASGVEPRFALNRPPAPRGVQFG